MPNGGGFGTFLGSLFESFGAAPDGAHVRIYAELKPWITRLLPSAARKWLPNISAGVRCAVPPRMIEGQPVGQCEHFGIAACDVCHKPVCLHHGRIDSIGDVICHVCVAFAMKLVPPALEKQAAARTQAPPPPPRDAPSPRGRPPSDLELSAAYRILKLKPGATWDQVKVKHRKLSGQHHPDRAGTNVRARTAAEVKFKEVQAAFDVLRRHYPEAA